MNINYRALCAELLDEIGHESPTTRLARAALAQLEPVSTEPDVEPEASWTEDEAIVAYDSAYRKSAGMEHTGFGAASSYTEHHREGIRAVLARYGRPAITPIPVSERLPGPEDCDAEGQCWWWHVDALAWFFRGANHRDFPLWTHWLPFHVLPLPQNPTP